MQDTDVTLRAKVKVSPLQTMEMHGDVDVRVHMFVAKALGRSMVASSTLGRLYPEKTPVLILRRLNGPENPFDTKKLRKISTSPPPGIDPDRLARSQASCRLNYLAHVTLNLHIIMQQNKNFI